ncbi:hypothetical protein FOZ63_010057, partial [Perkinsus olseni]
GFKAFGRFFGHDDKSKWKEHDACCLAQKYAGPALDVKIDVGFEDFVYVNAPVDQLRCRQFRDAAAGNPNVHLDFNERPGYDHSYFFVATFMEDHLNMEPSTLSRSTWITVGVLLAVALVLLGILHEAVIFERVVIGSDAGGERETVASTFSSVKDYRQLPVEVEILSPPGNG